LPWTLVLFEAPHRVVETLRALRAALGNRQVALARELTKKFEEVIRLTLDEALEHLRRHPPRGEFTVVVEGGQAPAASVAGMADRLRTLLDAGTSHRDAAQQVAAEFNISRRAAYQMALRMKRSLRGSDR
jgi:16S rRNA (cytidine1402-2'-O)-methyltransferase